jgi:predicted metalloendopeptidase
MLGVVIGHEIAHSLDKQTRKEKAGNMSWWNQDAEDSYEHLSQCFVQQYSSYQLPKSNFTLDGNLTMDENVCDFVGFQKAFQAFQSLHQPDVRLPGLTEYSPFQVFFIQYAQVWCEVTEPSKNKPEPHTDSHSPGKFRTNGVIVNSPQFGSLFGCPSGSPMNPETKCHLWSPKS